MTIQYKPVRGLNTTSLNKLIEISKKDLTTKVTTIETNLSELRTNVNNSNSKVATIETDLSELSGIVNNTNSKVATIETDLSELRDTVNNSNINPNINSNPYKGKIWTALGDSLTMTTSQNSIKHTPNGRGYIYWVNQKLEFAEINNMGLDSSTISTVRTSPQNFVQRMVNIPSTSNLITVFGGYNDMWSSTSKLGTINDTDTNTIYGALNKIARYLLTNYPKAIIVFFTTLHWTWEREGSSANPPYVVNPNGLTTPLLNQAIRDVGNKYGIPVIDLEKNSGIFPGTFNQNTGTATKYPHFSYYTYDGLHLNERGHQKIAKLIVNELLKLEYDYAFEDTTVTTISDPGETGTATAIAWATKYTSSTGGNTGGSGSGGNTGEGGGGTTPSPDQPTNYIDVSVAAASSAFTYANDNRSSVTNWTIGCAAPYPKSQATLGITLSTDASVTGDFTLVGTNVEGITVTNSNTLGGNKSGAQELVAVQGTAEGGFYLAFRLSHTRLGVEDIETNSTVMVTKFKEYLAACDWVLRFNK